MSDHLTPEHDGPDLLAALARSVEKARESRQRACSECQEPVDADGTWRGDCPGGSGEKCDTCQACCCDGSC